MDNLLLLLFILPLVAYVVYKLITYDWDQWQEDSKNMGDDMF
jgi:hypothetical protein